MKVFIYPTYAIALALGVGACADQVTIPTAGTYLVGDWLDQNTGLWATPTKVTWSARCEYAEFGPIKFDSTGRFSVESTRYEHTGNIRPTPGERLHLNGSIVAGQLRLSRYTVGNAEGSSDPIALTLTPGTRFDPLLCSA